MDPAYLNVLLDMAQPENPVYTVNSAIGTMLSHQYSRWAPREITEEGQTRKMSEIWSRNLSDTKLERSYFTDHVHRMKNMEGGSLNFEV